MTVAADVAPAGGVTGGRWRRFAPRGVLAFTMFFTGAAGFIYESVLGTVFSYLLGSSIEQMTLTMGIMLGMMGVAGWLQRFLRGPLVEYFVAVELLLAVLGGFAPIILQWAFAEMQADFVWIKLAYPSLIAILIGIEIPLAMRINEQFAKNLSSNIAGTSAWDYVGAFAGTVGWIWALKHFVPIMHLSFWVAISNLIVAFVSLVFFWRRGMLHRRTSRILLSLATMTVAIALVLGASNVDSWSKLISQKLYDDPIALQVTTKYQNIVLTKGPHPSDLGGTNWELYLNGNKQFASADEAIYHEYLVHPAMNLAASRKNVLVLGGGDGLAVREIKKYKDVKNITLVDLDPGMIELAKTNPILRELNGNAFADARVHSSISAGVTDTGDKQEVRLDTGETRKVDCEEVPTEDGRTKNDCDVEEATQKVADVNVFTIDADKFVSEPSEPYDVVIIDLPDPNSVELSKLYSKEFYSKVKRVLSPDGIVVVQSTSPYHAKETYLCILRTMAAAGLNVLPYHDNVPSFGDWGWIIGSPTVQADTLYERADTMNAFRVETKKVVAGNMTRALIFNRGDLRSDNTTVSTLMQPVVFEYYTYEAWRVD